MYPSIVFSITTEKEIKKEIDLKLDFGIFMAS